MYRNTLSFGNRAGRVLWGVVWAVLFRPSPAPFFGWRRVLLRLFGARISGSAVVYPSTRVWAPWNLTMEPYACLGREVDCYSVAPISIGRGATVSQRVFLCTASHDIRVPGNPLTTGPIVIKEGAFVFAEAFVGMNVVVEAGAVVAARAVVVRSVPEGEIVAGNPARTIGRRGDPRGVPITLEAGSHAKQ